MVLKDPSCLRNVFQRSLLSMQRFAKIPLVTAMCSKDPTCQYNDVQSMAHKQLSRARKSALRPDMQQQVQQWRQAKCHCMSPAWHELWCFFTA